MFVTLSESGLLSTPDCRRDSRYHLQTRPRGNVNFEVFAPFKSPRCATPRDRGNAWDALLKLSDRHVALA